LGLGIGTDYGTEQTDTDRAISVLLIGQTGIIIKSLNWDWDSICNGGKRKSFLEFFSFIIFIFWSWTVGDLNGMDGNHMVEMQGIGG
jgi:hypothetical protein